MKRSHNARHHPAGRQLTKHPTLADESQADSGRVHAVVGRGIGENMPTNRSLILAQQILDMLEQTDASGMEKWDALNIATRLVDLRTPPATGSDSPNHPAEDFDSWQSELEQP